MKLNKVNIKIFLFLCFITTLSNAQNITLKEAYNLMLSKNGEAKASSFEVKAMEEEHKATKGLRLPTIGVSGTYMHLDNDITVDLNEERNMVGGLLSITNPADVLGDWNFELQEKNLGFATADISMPIFAGGKINAATKASEIKLAITETKHKIKEDELTINLINYFFKLKLAQEAVKLRQDVYNVILLHNDQANKLFKNGLIPEVETLNAKVALSNAKRELLGAEKDVELAKTAVKNLIGINSLEGLKSNFNKPTIVKSVEEFKEEMLTENNQLKTIEKNQELAGIGLKVEKSDYFPKVGISGTYILGTDNLPLVDTKWFVGLGVEWEIFNGFQREHKIKASKYKISQVEQFDKQARLNLSTYTEKLYNTMQKELEQYESLNADEEFAKKLKFMRTRAFEEGTGTSLEVVDATLKLSEIKIHKIKALCEYNIAYGELMVLTGKTRSFLNQN
ncbi:TolC family protein [Polaribacter sargassicola]|uniref:TolC family protein n=1 Tax=Polaribacter sargassicola TaxID=2836891 RepID=UPI001F18577E|nr:TolC family protein [Polaribacter sp. DS7-9]MCG1037197.1 TolC family protein [Polaribacter sp. DS7-9]